MGSPEPCGGAGWGWHRAAPGLPPLAEAPATPAANIWTPTCHPTPYSLCCLSRHVTDLAGSHAILVGMGRRSAPERLPGPEQVRRCRSRTGLPAGRQVRQRVLKIRAVL